MSSSSNPSRTESRHDPEPDLHQEIPSVGDKTGSEEEDEEDQSEGAGNVLDDALHKSIVEQRSDDEECLVELSAPPVSEFGLFRRDPSLSDYDNFDVVTVHGLRDDHQTAWKSSKDSQPWIKSDLFPSSQIRQLDYVYDTGDSARVYGPDGIAMEANALLESLAQERVQLLDTERNRPIVWICHDLGSSIVKQALINAIFNQPTNGLQDDPERSQAIRNVYRRLPLLTSTIIFLGCPQDNESKEFLEDQLFGLICLPGPPVTTRMLQKISALASQTERINLEFLETNVLDRAVVVNITSAPKEQGQTDATCEPQVANQSTGAHNKVNEQTSDNQKSRLPLFPIRPGCMPHNLGIYYTVWEDTSDHLGLVRKDDTTGSGWAYHISQFLNANLGWNIRNNFAFLAYQNSLLSLSAPTQVKACRFDNGGSIRSPLVSWLFEHDVFNRTMTMHPGRTTLYIHGGSRKAIDMKFVSQLLCIDIDIRRDNHRSKLPNYGCFYYEFDRHDSRRCSIKAMIVSYVCTYAGRFWADTDDELEWFARYMGRFNCWSLKDLLTIFLRVQPSYGMNAMSVILGQFDQCDEEERSLFLQTMVNLQNSIDHRLQLIITTTRPEGFICEILPQDSIISLDDCSLSLDEFLLYPSQTGAAEERVQILLARRPEFAHLRLSLHQVFERFMDVPNLQNEVLEWLARYKIGCSADEATDIIREVSSDAHKGLLRGLMDRLSVKKQITVTHIYDWIKYAAEPLTLEILAEAIRYSLPQEMAQLQHIQNQEEFGRFVKQYMGGITLQVGRDIRFSDDSFYEISEIGESCEGQKHACRAHSEMAAVCLRYLLGKEGQEMLASLSVKNQGMDDPRWSPIMLPRHSLVSYALRFWTFHYQAAGDYRPIDLSAELFRDTIKRKAWAEAFYVVSNPFTRSNKGYISSLPYMAMFGLDDLVLRQIEGEAKQDGWKQDCWLAIAEAARNGHGTTVALLLEHTDNDIAGLGEALRWAASYGEGGALDCLISKARELENYQWPPFILDRAVVAGLANLVSALVEAGYDLDEESGCGKFRAVHTAIIYGQDRVLKILLDSGRVDLGPQDGLWGSTWILAVQAGNTASIQHMLDAGASLDNFDVAKDVLFWTVSNGRHGALRFLIDAQVFSKSHINWKATVHGDNYYFPLEEAAGRAHRNCTRILLDNDADPNVVGEYGSALYRAVASTQDDPICRMLLEKGANPNQSSVDDPAYNGMDMLLIRAIGFGRKLLVETLLDYGAKINVADPNRTEEDTPLAYAIKWDKVDIVRLLLERGADANLVSEEKPHCWSPLYTAAYWRSTEVIEPLIKHGADIRWTNKADGWSAFHAAYDSADALSTLLHNGVDINSVEDANWTALMMAARHEASKSVEVLLKWEDPKADLEIMTSNEPSSTALHLASYEGYAEIVKMLLDAGADINRQRDDGKFPLGQVLASDMLQPACEDLVRFMLKRKPDLALSDNEGNTVLHNIKPETPLSMVMLLVEEGAPVNTFNHLGYNPLAWAVRCGNIAAARYLTTVKGSQTRVSHPDFGSILHMAVTNSTLEMVRQLVRTGADHGIVDSGSGASVLYSAIGHKDEEEGRNIIEYLVEEVGVDVNARGGKWIFPLMRVVGESMEGEREPLLEYLLKHGARTDSVDSLGRNSVHWAVVRHKLDKLKILVKNGVDLSVGDNYGRTPLHFAAGKGSLELVRCILDKLSKDSEASHVDAADVDGWTPLMWACRDNLEVAEVLVKEYKVDIRVRSEGAEWSPLKITRLYGSPYSWAKYLDPDLDSQGHEENRESQYDSQIAPGTNRWIMCAGCDMRIVGQAWCCETCTDYLCFKCVRHSDTMHDPEHIFVDLDEVEKDEEGTDLDAKIVDPLGCVVDSYEEQDEDDSESEEEEDDESD